MTAKTTTTSSKEVTVLKRISNLVVNYGLVLTSPIWIIPFLIVALGIDLNTEQDKRRTKQLLTGERTIYGLR